MDNHPIPNWIAAHRLEPLSVVRSGHDLHDSPLWHPDWRCSLAVRGELIHFNPAGSSVTVVDAAGPQTFSPPSDKDFSQLAFQLNNSPLYQDEPFSLVGTWVGTRNTFYVHDVITYSPESMNYKRRIELAQSALAAAAPYENIRCRVRFLRTVSDPEKAALWRLAVRDTGLYGLRIFQTVDNETPGMPSNVLWRPLRTANVLPLSYPNHGVRGAPLVLSVGCYKYSPTLGGENAMHLWPYELKQVAVVDLPRALKQVGKLSTWKPMVVTYRSLFEDELLEAQLHSVTLTMPHSRCMFRHLVPDKSTQVPKEYIFPKHNPYSS